MIELRAAGFQYPGGEEGETVFSGLDFSLRGGERVGLVGANGAGKSTLMRLIMGLSEVQSGEVFLFGQPCRAEEDFARLRMRIGYLFQDSDDQLFSPTVEEDVSFGPLNLGRTHAEAREDVEEACRRLGIEHLRRKITHRLSAGQKRLVALATVAAMKPDVYLLDEPTAGLDRAGIRTLLRFLDEHVSTCLIASHDRDLLQSATRGEFSL